MFEMLLKYVMMLIISLDFMIEREISMEENKSYFGKGIYGKKDAPIRVLDKFIIGAIALIIVFICAFTLNGGFSITFESDGGSEVSYQKVKYGELIEEPTDIIKAGYVLEKWVTSEDETLAVEWDFSEDTVENDMELFAIWTPAEIVVKFDLDGGLVDGEGSAEEQVVSYGSVYGDLPTVEKDGYVFGGWVYSGNVIDENSIVEATGEHVLTALWVEE